MDKYLIDVDMTKCAAKGGCPLACLSVCPTKVLAHRPLNAALPDGDIHIQATHPLLCNGCMECVASCKSGAVSVTASRGQS